MDNDSTNQEQKDADSEMSSCEHTKDCCVVPPSITIKIGKRWASALAGLIAGVVIASLVLIPWMAFQGILCEEARLPWVQPPVGERLEEGEPSGDAAGIQLEGTPQEVVPAPQN